LRDAVRDERLASKIAEADKREIERLLDEAVKWLDAHQTAAKEECEEKQRELESKVYPIMATSLRALDEIEKLTGRANKITITNQKGRLSRDDIERMMRDAERYKSEDEANRPRIIAKNALENYAFSVRNALRDEKLAGNITAADNREIQRLLDEAVRWLDAHQAAAKEEYEEKQRKLESKVSPIMAKIFFAVCGGGRLGQTPGGGSGSTASGAKIDEIDDEILPALARLDGGSGGGGGGSGSSADTCSIEAFRALEAALAEARVRVVAVMAERDATRIAADVARRDAADARLDAARARQETAATAAATTAAATAEMRRALDEARTSAARAAAEASGAGMHVLLA
jgi:hypothetical protein